MMIDSFFAQKDTKGPKRKQDHEKGAKGPRRKEKCSEDTESSASNVRSLSDQCTTFSNLRFLKNPATKLDLKWKKIIKENLDLDYVLLFSKKEADLVFQEAEKVIKYNADSRVFIHGQWHKVPRKQAAYGDHGLSYTFSGATVAANPWNEAPFLKDICDIVSSITGHTFNFVLVNRYKDGADHMGEHRDDEADLVPRSAIASVSLGQERDFVFRHKDARGGKAKRKMDPVKLGLAHGSLLMMNHPTNVYWFHSLPVRKKAVFPRINLTFRQMVVK